MTEPTTVDVNKAITDAILAVGDGTEIADEQVAEQEVDDQEPDVELDVPETTEESVAAEPAPASVEEEPLPEHAKWAEGLDLSDADTVAAVNFFAGGPKDERFKMSAANIEKNYGPELLNKFKDAQRAYTKFRNEQRPVKNEDEVLLDWTRKRLKEKMEREALESQATPSAPVEDNVKDLYAKHKEAVESGDGELVATTLEQIVEKSIAKAVAQTDNSVSQRLQEQKMREYVAEVDRRSAELAHVEGLRYEEMLEPRRELGGESQISYVLKNVPVNPITLERIVWPEDAFNYLIGQTKGNGTPLSVRPSRHPQPPVDSASGSVPEETAVEASMGWRERIEYEMRKSNMIR